MMLNIRRHSLFTVTLLSFLMIAAIGVLVNAFGVSAADSRKPLEMPAADLLPHTTCTLSAPGERTCNLIADEGSVTVPDGTLVPIWGFANNVVDPVSIPGPLLIVEKGDAVTVNFTNNVDGETISLAFTGQQMLDENGSSIAPDLTGIPTGSTTSYSFVASEAGTFKYEAGLTPNGVRQVAMGLTGALIVREPGAVTEAYGFAYDDEALVFLNELDPDFAADPNNFDMVQYSPAYYLMNGKSYAETSKIPVDPGDVLILRYINAGLLEHSIGVLGLYQTWIAVDGQARYVDVNSQAPQQYSQEMIAYTLGAGESIDTVVTIPADAPALQNYPLYNTGLQQLYNSSAVQSVGGIFTFIEVSAAGSARPTAGPLTDNVVVGPNPTAGTTDVTLDAHFDSSSTSNLPIVTMEYFLNDLGAPGTGVQIDLSPGSTTITGTAVITPSTLTALPSGDVSIYVRGQDSGGTWGPVNSTVLDLVTEGPLITSLALTNNPTNGSSPITIRATADDNPVGELNVIAGEYFIDVVGNEGEGIVMDISQEAPIASLTAVIETTAINALTHGTHMVYVRAQDELGNWGQPEMIALNVDLLGPTASLVNLSPNPTNGEIAVNPASNGVRLEIDAADPSTIAEAEGFIDYQDPQENPDGSGFPLIASDALYNGTIERAYFDIPLSTIRQLTEGDHEISFHARDAAGNWGDVQSTTLTVDLNGPDVTDIVIDPNPGRRNRDITISAIVADWHGTNPGSAIVAAEWFIDIDPGFGNGTPFEAVDGLFDQTEEAVVSTFRTSLRRGDYMLFVRALDSAGNWSSPAFVPFTIQGGQINFGDSFESGNFASWLNVVGDVNFSTAAAFGGTNGIVTILDYGAPAYLVGSALEGDSAAACSTNTFDFGTRYLSLPGDGVDIFQTLDKYNNSVYGLVLEEGPVDNELYIWVMQDGVRQLSEGVHIPTAADHIQIELVWNAKEGELDLMIDGQVETSLTGLTVSDFSIDSFWLGASALEGTMTNMSGELYFDNFLAEPCFYDTYLPFTVNGGGN